MEGLVVVDSDVAMVDMEGRSDVNDFAVVDKAASDAVDKLMMEDRFYLLRFSLFLNLLLLAVMPMATAKVVMAVAMIWTFLVVKTVVISCPWVCKVEGS